MSYLNRETTVNLSRLLVASAVDLFSELDVRGYFSGKKITGACAVHGGKNITSFNMWRGGVAPGSWSCYSEKCEEKYGKSTLGFVHGVLDGRESCSKDQALEWCLNFLGKDLSEIAVSQEDVEKIEFSNYFSRPQIKQVKIDRALVEKSLTIPAKYYKGKFKDETLKFFQIGDCLTPGREMTGRAVFPVYEEFGKYVVGCVGRAYEGLPKWQNSLSLRASETLFNYNNAKPYIRKSGRCRIVEGQSDVARLWELGVRNVVGLFGSKIMDGQQILLESSGAMTLELMFDNDEAGQRGLELCRPLSRLFNLEKVKYDHDDPEQLISLNDVSLEKYK